MTDDWIPEFTKTCVFKNSPNIPNEFAMLMVGARRSGKTTLLLKMLLTEGFLDYNRLLIISTTIHQDKIQMLYHGFKIGLTKEDMKQIFIKQQNNTNIKKLKIEEICEYAKDRKEEINTEKSDIECVLCDKVTEIPSPKSVSKLFQKPIKEPKTLVVLDDCIDEVQNNINKFYTNGRHYNINVIYLSQNFTKLTKNGVRDNANFIIVLKQPIADLKMIFRKYFSPDKNELEDFIQKCHTLFKKNYEGKYIALNLENGDIKENIFNANKSKSDSESESEYE